jgi:hypothetical protein
MCVASRADYGSSLRRASTCASTGTEHPPGMWSSHAMARRLRV